jgi:hypothetical protein
MCDLSPVRKQLYGSFVSVRERANLRDEKQPRGIIFGDKNGPPVISPEKRVIHTSYLNWPNTLRNLYQSQFVTPTKLHSSQKISQINVDDYKKYFLKIKRSLDFSVWKEIAFTDIKNSTRLGDEEKRIYLAAVTSLSDGDLNKIYQVLKKEYNQSQSDQLQIRNKQSSTDISYQTEKYSGGFSSYSPHKQSKGKDHLGIGKRSSWDAASPSREHLLAEIKKEHSITEHNRGKSPVFKK